MLPATRILVLAEPADLFLAEPVLGRVGHGLSLPPLATLPVLVNRFPTSSAEELNTKPQSDLPTVDNLGCGPLASAVLDRGLEAETPAEAKDALAQLQALLDVHKLVAVALLEPHQVLLFWGRVR